MTHMVNPEGGDLYVIQKSQKGRIINRYQRVPRASPVGMYLLHDNQDYSVHATAYYILSGKGSVEAQDLIGSHFHPLGPFPHLLKPIKSRTIQLCPAEESSRAVQKCHPHWSWSPKDPWWSPGPPGDEICPACRSNMGGTMGWFYHWKSTHLDQVILGHTFKIFSQAGHKYPLVSSAPWLAGQFPI